MNLLRILVCVAVVSAAVVTTPDSVEARGRRPVEPMQQIVLQVCHPQTQCLLEVPVCVPLCCQGAPCVRFQRTLIGQGKSVFTWACGHEVIVRYRHGGGYRVID